VTEFRVTFVIEKRRIQLDMRPSSVVSLVTSNWTTGTDYLWDLSSAFGAFFSREFRPQCGTLSNFLKSFVSEKEKRRVWLQLGILLGILLGTLLGAPIVTCLLRSLGFVDM
jgi:hypothetical protein